MKMIFLSLLIVFSATGLQAYTGPGGFDHGNGGDMCENRIKSVRDELSQWLTNGGAAGLRFPSAVSHEDYRRAMLTAMSTAKVSCGNVSLFVGRAEKTCKNFTDSSGALRIQCNTDRFMANSRSNQFILVHHEYAGLAGLEVNKGEVSNYEISNQIIRGLLGVRLNQVSVTLRFLAKIAQLPGLDNFDRATKNNALCMYIGRMSEGEMTVDLYREFVLLGNVETANKLRVNLMSLMNYCIGNHVTDDPRPISFEDAEALSARISEIQTQISEIEKQLERRFVDKND